MLSFEGDRIGKMIGNYLMKNSYGTDIRILVDSYTKYIQRDKLKFLNSTSKIQYKKTMNLFTKLRNKGIKIKFTNPTGPIFLRFLARNHKKCIIIDNNTIYLGGRNFSDHNFFWHDMMIRVQSSNLALFLKNDFILTWNGINQSISKSFEGLELLLLDGKQNHVQIKKVTNLINTAKTNIYVHSPYLTFPLYDNLRKARRKGVAVTVITSEKNNRGAMNEYTRWECLRSQIKLFFFTEKKMSHLKAMVIDNNYLILGSWNFDYLGFKLFQENIVIITQKNTIIEFKERIINDDLNKSRIASVKSFKRKTMLNKLIWQLLINFSTFANNRIPQKKI